MIIKVIFLFPLFNNSKQTLLASKCSDASVTFKVPKRTETAGCLFSGYLLTKSGEFKSDFFQLKAENGFIGRMVLNYSKNR